MARGRHGIYSASLNGDWQKLGDVFARLSVQFPMAVKRALAQEGEFYRRKIVEGLREQAPGGKKLKPLSPVTLALRRLMGFRGTKALIRSGDLRNSVVNVKVSDYAQFVGVLYSARGGDGRKLADIARIHEYGAVVRMGISRKRMRVIAMALRKAGKGSGLMSGSGLGVGMVRIPARPFLQPVFDMYAGKRGGDRMQARVARQLGGLLGVITHPDLGGHSAAALPEKFVGGGTGRAMRAARSGRMTKPRPLNPIRYGKVTRWRSK